MQSFVLFLSLYTMLDWSVSLPALRYGLALPQKLKLGIAPNIVLSLPYNVIPHRVGHPIELAIPCQDPSHFPTTHNAATTRYRIAFL
jgi:hypothetical protein